MANKKFGSILRDLRNKSGYTQQQVADLLGLKNKSTLGSWEVGKSEPDGYTFLRLLKIYQVSDVYKTFDDLFPESLKCSDTTNSDPQLEQLTTNYQVLNGEGQEKLVDYSDDLVSSGKYIKPYSSQLEKKA